MTTRTETVERLLQEALMKTSHPEAHLLTLAENVLDPRSAEPLPKGAARRMSTPEAFAAATAVTRMMRRHGLVPSDVCRDAGVANQPTGFFQFHLTQGEMDASGALTAPLQPSRRIHKGLIAYARLARAVAARSDASEADILQELGLAVAGYLAPFAAADRSPWDLLGEDVALLGSYFTKVRKGADVEPVDLRRYFWDADRMNVVYDPDGSRMEPRPDRSQDGTGFDLAPRIPLFARTVASGGIDCREWDEGPDGEPFSMPVGYMQASIVEVFHLEIVPDRKGLRVIVSAEPWTATFGDVGPGRSHPWGKGGLTDFVRGTPLPYSMNVHRDGTTYCINFEDRLPRFHCADYERHVQDALAGADHARANDWDPSGCYRALSVPRRFDLDAETLRMLLGRRADDTWRQQLSAFGDTPSHLRSFALPGAVALPDGARSDALADRFREGLLGDGHEILAALMEAVTRRVRAMDAYLAERTDGERFRRDRYRRLMRS